MVELVLPIKALSHAVMQRHDYKPRDAQQSKRSIHFFSVYHTHKDADGHKTSSGALKIVTDGPLQANHV
jgi:hypothetical protein